MIKVFHVDYFVFEDHSNTETLYPRYLVYDLRTILNILEQEDMKKWGSKVNYSMLNLLHSIEGIGVRIKSENIFLTD